MGLLLKITIPNLIKLEEFYYLAKHLNGSTAL